MELRVEKIRGALSAALVAALAWANSAGAAEHIKIGALKSTNVGATYIAIEKGFFAKEGLEPELVTTETAQTTAVAAAASSIDFGTTSTSAGLSSSPARASSGSSAASTTRRRAFTTSPPRSP